MNREAPHPRLLGATADVLDGRVFEPTGASATAFAPANIALCKYWGKRDTVLNLPVTDSLSLSLGKCGSQVEIAVANGGRDEVSLNGQVLDGASGFSQRLFGYIDLFRGADGPRLRIDTTNTVPTAAGFASSASGFAAVIRALDRLCAWDLSDTGLSILARLGSGSACRSVFDGLVQWSAGQRDDGMDSYAAPLADQWPELRIGLLVLTADAKPIGSREAMRRTVDTSPLYAAWPDTVAAHMQAIKESVAERDFHALGGAAECNALAMHATMMAARPPVLYWLPESVGILRRVRELRDQGLAVYATMDAGPNVKLLYLAGDADDIQAAFPKMQPTC